MIVINGNGNGGECARPPFSSSESENTEEIMMGLNERLGTTIIRALG